MKAKLLSGILSVVGIFLIVLAVFFETNTYAINDTKIEEVNINNIGKINNKVEGEKTLLYDFETVKMKATPASIVIPPRVEVYEKMTIEELGEKLQRNMKSSLLAGKGIYLANECIRLNVDPYIALAIMLHETGCNGSCSSLMRNCNNVGGQKGSPACSGSYRGYDTLDQGITGFVENLSKNYFSVGRTTPETIGPKYASGQTWPSKINSYVSQIRAN